MKGLLSSTDTPSVGLPSDELQSRLFEPELRGDVSGTSTRLNDFKLDDNKQGNPGPLGKEVGWPWWIWRVWRGLCELFDASPHFPSLLPTSLYFFLGLGARWQCGSLYHYTWCPRRFRPNPLIP